MTKTVEITIKLPMDFHANWDNDMIEFQLNESSWCWDNLIDELNNYSKKHGCICNICEGKVIKEQ